LVLEEFHKELEVIRPFTPSLFKVTEIGYLLKCFYRLYNNKEYENAMFYSFGFNGYLDNLRGAFRTLRKTSWDYLFLIQKIKQDLRMNIITLVE
jgi:hypothetical protein